MWFNKKNVSEDVFEELNNRIENLETQKKYLKKRIIELDQKNKNLEDLIRYQDYKIGGIKVTASMAQQSVSRYRKQEAEISKREVESKILEAADLGRQGVYFGEFRLAQFIKSNIEYFEEKGFDVKVSDKYKLDAIISWHEKTEFEKLIDKMGDSYSEKLSFKNDRSETSKLISKYYDEITKVYDVSHDYGSIIYTKR